MITTDRALSFYVEYNLIDQVHKSQVIIGNNAGILLIGRLGTSYSEILIIIKLFACRKTYL